MAKGATLAADLLLALNSDAISVEHALKALPEVRFIRATSADDLFERLARERYDALLLSEAYDGLDAQGLISLIRSGKLCAPALPIVLLAHNPHPEFAGVLETHFVETAFAPDAPTLAAAIRSAIDGRPRPSLLIIDDHSDWLSLAADRLAPSFAVTTLIEPDRAAEAAAAIRPDIIVTDYAMPLVDGESVARTLRACGVEAPIVVLTAHDTPQNHITLTKAGVTRFISKKTSFQELEYALRMLVLDAAAARALRNQETDKGAAARLLNAVEAARADLAVGRAAFAAERLKGAAIRVRADAAGLSLVGRTNEG